VKDELIRLGATPHRHDERAELIDQMGAANASRSYPRSSIGILGLHRQPSP
jgi:hypothetical protein